MFDEDDNNKRDDRNQKKPSGGLNMPPFTWVAWIVILGALIALMVVRGHLSPQTGVTLEESDFFQKFDSNQISSATITYNPTMGGAVTISGKFLQASKDGKLILDSGG